MTYEKFREKYYNLLQFLGTFALEADFDQYDFDVSITKWYGVRQKESAIQILAEAEELFKAEEFPYKIINEISCVYPEHPNHNAETTKQWLKDMLVILKARVGLE